MHSSVSDVCKKIDKPAATSNLAKSRFIMEISLTRERYLHASHPIIRKPRRGCL